MSSPYSIAILAGGKSRRMGQPKALLELGGETVLQRIISVLQPLTDDLFLVANEAALYQLFGLSVVADTIPNKGPLGGIYTALQTARHDWVFVVACDLPLLQAEVISFLAQQRTRVDVVCPHIFKQPETLHTFYRKSCLPHVEARLATDYLSVASLFELVRVHYLLAETLVAITPNFDFLLNMNTPADFDQVRKQLDPSSEVGNKN